MFLIALILCERSRHSSHHEATVHRICWLSRLVFALSRGRVVMGASSAHHAMCAPVSDQHVLCCSSFSFCVGLFRGLASIMAVPTLFSFRLHLTFGVFSFSYISSIPFNSVASTFQIDRSLLLHLYTLLLVHSLTLSAEIWICLIKTNPRTLCSLRCFTSNVTIIPSRFFSNVELFRIVTTLFIQHHNVSSSDNFLL